MGKVRFDEILDSLVDELAAIEHERWSHWQRYMHDKATRQLDGSLVVPPELVARWEDQISRHYRDLSDKEQESDREQVRKYLPVILAALNKGS
jgi:hypothetical protein